TRRRHTGGGAAFTRSVGRREQAALVGPGNRLRLTEAVILPILTIGLRRHGPRRRGRRRGCHRFTAVRARRRARRRDRWNSTVAGRAGAPPNRKSTRLNSSHA